MMLEEEPLRDCVRLSAEEVNVGVVGEGEWEWEDTGERFVYNWALCARGDGGGEYSC
jgi:hypothetical protein